MKYTICAVTGTRADYGLLKETLFRLQQNESITLDLMVTGSHLSSAFGNTEEEIREDGFRDYSCIPIPLEDDSKEGMAKATGAAVCAFADYFLNYRPDLLLVLGDRYEILAAAIAAHMQGIPIAHISGGDVTEGAVDDAIRHSVTKLSLLHFPGCEQSRRRIIQMGESPDRVFNVGEPGVENCMKTRILNRESLAKNLDFPSLLGDYAVVTFHPVTMEDNTGGEQVRALIRAMDDIQNLAYIITLANVDAGGRLINQIWQAEGKIHRNWLVISSLGAVRYLSAMKYAQAVIGNSSSGIIEAPTMGIPTVNIGDRQKGRMMCESIISCEPEEAKIRDAILQVLQPAFRQIAQHVISPFGDGHTSEQIEYHLIQYLKENRNTTEKAFYDINFALG